ncbi:ABC transporter permease [Natrinema versiforme]|uniref:ABC transporter permease subunit n=1 Tax=Natrinema versiforme TaxID=88724 RepID=A0A4P8WNM8_9EURY|nr:ABC transporter permease subunit [Natrinema versiforme]QCS44985.1 ABC transporter permease subunit [Natrinema versiforme]
MMRKVVAAGWISQIAIPIAAFVAMWQLAAMAIANPATLPTPAHVFSLAIEFSLQPGPRGYTAIYHLERTFLRVLIATVIALSLSVVFGILMWRSETVEAVLSDWLPFWMTIPTVILILICMILFQFSTMSVIVAVLVAATPFGIVNLWEGMKSVDTGLLEMTAAFDASSFQVWKDVYVPHLSPYIFGTFRYILGMVWKIVALAEVFGIQSGIGSMFRYWYSQGRIDALLAYLLVFVLVMLTIEYGVLKPVEWRTFKWRDSNVS